MASCIIFNPTARGERARHFRAQLQRLISDCALRPTTGPGTARALARQAVEDGFSTVVAAGGDGTVNEVLNGLGDFPDAFARVRLGVLPLGTVNVFAKELSLPDTLAGQWELIRQGRSRAIDLPWVEHDVDGRPVRRYFVQMAGAGWDARTIERVSWALKKRFGPLAYVVAGLRALADDLPPVTVSNGERSVSGQLVLVGNGVYYGGRYRVFPQASLSDGQLEVTVFPRLNLAGVVRGSWGLLVDRLYSSGGAIHLRGACLAITASRPMPFHVEGENIGHLPARFGLVPLGVHVLGKFAS